MPLFNGSSSEFNGQHDSKIGILNFVLAQNQVSVKALVKFSLRFSCPWLPSPDLKHKCTQFQGQSNANTNASPVCLNCDMCLSWHLNYEGCYFLLGSIISKN